MHSVCLHKPGVTCQYLVVLSQRGEQMQQAARLDLLQLKHLIEHVLLEVLQVYLPQKKVAISGKDWYCKCSNDYKDARFI